MLLGQLGEGVELRARQLARAGVDALHDAAGLERAGEHLELGAGERFAEIVQLEAEARVGTVDAEARSTASA